MQNASKRKHDKLRRQFIVQEEEEEAKFQVLVEVANHLFKFKIRIFGVRKFSSSVAGRICMRRIEVLLDAQYRIITRLQSSVVGPRFFLQFGVGKRSRKKNCPYAHPRSI